MEYRQGTGTRVVAGALALWFGLVAAAPAVLHGCPRAIAEAGAADQGVPAAPAAHHHHGAPAGSDQGSGLPQPCTCLGTCATAAAAVLARAPELPALVVLPQAGGAISAAPDSAASHTPAHARPFATAPPLRTA